MLIQPTLKMSNKTKINIDLLLKILMVLSLFCISLRANDVVGAAKTANVNYSQQWLGWRGVTTAGEVKAFQAPTFWSNQHNVLWKKALPENGHSSPIVIGDKVIVTAAYQVYQATYIKQAANIVAIGLLLLLGIVVFRYILQYCRTEENLLRNIMPLSSTVGLGVMFLLLSAFVLFGENALDFSQDSIRSWLASGIGIALCLMMLALRFPRNSRQRFYSGIVFILMALPFIYFIPQKEYVFKGGYFTMRESALVVYAIAGLFVLIGITLIAVYARNRQKKFDVYRQRVANRKFVFNMAVTGGLIFAVIGILVLSVVVAIQSSELLNYHYNKPSFNNGLNSRYTPVMGWWSFVAFIAGLVAAFLFSLKKKRELQFETQPKRIQWFKQYELLLGTFIFVNINLLAFNLERSRSILAFDRNNGEKLWTCEALTSPLEDVHRLNSLATPTPVSDGNYVYGYFGKAGIVCADLDGNPVWVNRELDFENIHGAATSPVLEDGILVICGDQPKSAYIAALDAKTGKIVWKVERSDNKVYFNGSSRTPQITSVNGRKAIVLWGWEDIKLYDLENGDELASYRIQHQNGDSMCSSPILYNDILYLVQKRTILSLSLRKIVNGEKPLEWKSKVRGPFVATPVIRNGLLFTVTEKGIVYCIDTITGEKVWEKRMKGEFYPSPIAIDNQIYFCDNDGRTIVFAAERECQIISECDLGENTFSSFAFGDGQLFIRTQNNLFCVQEFSAPALVVANDL